MSASMASVITLDTASKNTPISGYIGKLFKKNQISAVFVRSRSELSIPDFFVRLSVRLFITKFLKKCQKSIRTLHGSDSIRPRLNYTRSFI